MFFLMRIAFWLCIVLALLPAVGSKQGTETSAQNTEVTAVETISAAVATMSDMRHFCERQPDACAVGSQAAVAFGQRAQAGAKMVYEFINERMATQGIDSPTTRPATEKSARSAKPSQNTLTSKDLAVPWRGPSPREQAAGRKPA